MQCPSVPWMKMAPWLAAGCPSDTPLSLSGPLAPAQPRKAAPCHPSILSSTSSRMGAALQPCSLWSQLPQGQKHPGPHPAEEILTTNSSSSSNTAQGQHEGSYAHRCLLKPCDALAPSQHCHGPVPATHFAVFQLPRAGDGVSLTILLLPPIPPQGCCTHREATQLTVGA